MDQALQVFVTAAEERSFTRAASKLHMTQPAVSQYIRQLEERTGAKLFDRTNKYVRLTKAGEIVYHHARDILGLYSRMELLVADLMQIASGPVAIGASYTFGEYVLPHVAAELQHTYPLINPSITIGNTREIAESVMNHRLDIGIIEGEFRHERLRIESFAEDAMEIYISAAHPLAGQSWSSAAELAQLPWIVRELGSGTREATERFFEASAMRPANLMTFGSTQIIKESVEAGLGIALLSRWTVRKELALGTLTQVEVAGTPVQRHFSLVTQETPYHTKAAQTVIEVLRSGQWTLQST